MADEEERPLPGENGSGPDASTKRAPRNVVICVGNSFRGDDAFGVRVAAELRKHLSPDVLLLESDGEPTGLIEAWDGADTVVVVDAVRTGNLPGTVLRRELGHGPLMKSARPESSHPLGVAETIALAGAFGRLPRRLIVWGVEAQVFDAGRPPTNRVIAAIPRLVRGVLRDLGAVPEGEEPSDP